MREIGRIVHNGHHSLYVEYLCITNWDKCSIALQEGETIAYRWVSKDVLFEMGSDILASARTLKLLKEICK